MPRRPVEQRIEAQARPPGVAHGRVDGRRQPERDEAARRRDMGGHVRHDRQAAIVAVEVRGGRFGRQAGALQRGAEIDRHRRQRHPSAQFDAVIDRIARIDGAKQAVGPDGIAAQMLPGRAEHRAVQVQPVVEKAYPPAQFEALQLVAGDAAIGRRCGPADRDRPDRARITQPDQPEAVAVPAERGARRHAEAGGPLAVGALLLEMAGRRESAQPQLEIERIAQALRPFGEQRDVRHVFLVAAYGDGGGTADGHEAALQSADGMQHRRTEEPGMAGGRVAQPHLLRHELRRPILDIG